MSAICDFLQRRLDTGEWRIGQVLVRPGISLRHVGDAERADLEVFHRPEDAREIAKYDGEGNYRPLKTAPNLRRGWRLELRSVEELRLALDFIYPAAIGARVELESGRLIPIPLRETLNRQTGMYRVTQHVTDEQADAVIREICIEGCLRRRLWGGEAVGENDIACAEACNLLVAAIRPVAKGNLPAAEVSP